MTKVSYVWRTYDPDHDPDFNLFGAIDLTSLSVIKDAMPNYPAYAKVPAHIRHGDLTISDCKKVRINRSFKA